jgi:hypothetical protein
VTLTPNFLSLSIAAENLVDESSSLFVIFPPSLYPTAHSRSPGQIGVGIFQLFVLITVPQLTLHASIAAFILLVLLYRSLAPILILRFVHECFSWSTTAPPHGYGSSVVSAFSHSEALSLEFATREWLSLSW